MDTDSYHNKDDMSSTLRMWRVPCMITRRNRGGGGTLSLASSGSTADKHVGQKAPMKGSR